MGWHGMIGHLFSLKGSHQMGFISATLVSLAVILLMICCVGFIKPTLIKFEKRENVSWFLLISFITLNFGLLVALIEKPRFP